jgi:hypothetical protein
VIFTMVVVRAGTECSRSLHTFLHIHAISRKLTYILDDEKTQNPVGLIPVRVQVPPPAPFDP